MQQHVYNKLACACDIGCCRYQGGLAVWSEFSKHKDAWLFAEPVKEEEAPGYYDMIEHPMDLTTIREQLDDKLYARKEDFAKDVSSLPS